MTNKKLTKLVCAAVASATLIFGGCGPVAENENVPSANGEENRSVLPGNEGVMTTPTANAAIPNSARNTPVVQVAREAGPAVVGITNKVVVRDFFNRQGEAAGSGSGVIFRSDGYIVTNNHVIADINDAERGIVTASKELIISLADGTTLNGTLVGTDEMTDIAVIKVDAQNLPAAKFGNSEEVMVGEPVVAIGSPLGLQYQGSVTVGVISAFRTFNLNDDRSVTYLQTDAAINPGNSGGALLNYDGEVIGINTWKNFSSDDGRNAEGMAFAIPINTVQKVVAELMEKGYVARPYLGVTIFDKPTAAHNGYILNIDKGVFVYQVALGSPADRAGLQRGDIILKLDDKEVNTVGAVSANIKSRNIGDKVRITYDRNGNEQTVEVTLEEMPRSNDTNNNNNYNYGDNYGDNYGNGGEDYGYRERKQKR